MNTEKLRYQLSKRNEKTDFTMHKESYFTFIGTTYTEANNIRISSPLGLVLLGVFMVESKNDLTHNLSKHLICWKKYR